MKFELALQVRGVASDIEVWDAIRRATGNIVYDQDNVTEEFERFVFHV
jgi:hypothetical protein